ncbi:MAG: hypothetical protein MJY95_07565 [Bacteroidaceae bacterium]|nr:hypothetical protein [Bacteroidaceae bacterium]
MDRKIFVSDITMKLADSEKGNRLSFRQKIELAKMLDKLGVSVIETGPIVNGKQDSLLIKSLASTVKKGILAVPVDIFNPDSIEETWNALKGAAHPRLQVSVPVSTVQMEYLCHKKPAAIIELVADLVSRCAKVCKDVEFVAADFGRSEQEFLLNAVKTAVDNGASIVTIFDTAGNLFEYEFYDSTKWIRNILPEGVKLGVWCSNEMFMADTCAIAAVRAGADEIKTTPYGDTTASLKRFVKILSSKADVCKAHCDVKATELKRAVEQIKSLCEADRYKPYIVEDELQADRNELKLTVHDDMNAVVKVAGKLGYDLDEADSKKVYDAFIKFAEKNETVEAKELDAIVASVAFQAPPIYCLESYLINSGNLISAVCHLRLKKDDALLDSVSLGDGPVDAAFRAIEQLVGRQYELDDFQIQSVTEGREAMGGTVVRLRHNGKIYSGRGVSRDIVGASIMAYLNAVNKIVSEEEEA